MSTSSSSLQAPAQPASAPAGHAIPLMELIALAIGLLAMYVPTYMKLDAQVWSQEGQGHGPVMLALTIWLVWKRWPELMAAPDDNKFVPASLFMLVAVFFYVIGRSQDFPEFEASSQIPLVIAILLSLKGWRGVKIMAFPIFFLIFLIPLPQILVMVVTAPLKMGVSVVAEAALHAAGYPMGRTGVTLSIGQYQLLVADACAGLNSIFALEAIGVFYMSMMGHTNPKRNILIALLILPISFASNVIRVITLVLVTYYFGDEAGQGFVHGFAGIMLFMIATMLTVATDTVIGRFIPGNKEEEAQLTAQKA
ncbi:MAG: exosortase B [Gammaproteobacteria bacterium]|nr:exosortase B [Gammaproteobacteria bacterium]